MFFSNFYFRINLKSFFQFSFCYFFQLSTGKSLHSCCYFILILMAIMVMVMPWLAGWLASWQWCWKEIATFIFLTHLYCLAPWLAADCRLQLVAVFPWTPSCPPCPPCQPAYLPFFATPYLSFMHKEVVQWHWHHYIHSHISWVYVCARIHK